MHCSGVQRDSMGDPLFATRGQWRRRASDETSPIDLLLLYCVRRPAVFSRFLVCQSHKPKERNKVYTSVSIVLLFKNSTAGMQFLLSSHRFSQISPPAQLRHRRTLVTHRRSQPRWTARPQRVFAFPQDVVSQASKTSPRCQTTLLIAISLQVLDGLLLHHWCLPYRCIAHSFKQR